ncbi:uncharacterized protein LOC142047163 [Chelonoidis abingdonii]|uniref:uncharacterized protein LOC142047163 n=1 Tax=Chelonoidis abingdonii TaxID=106734 RepID=UPI003F492BCF
MLERGHDWDALQCKVKVKELQSAYCKVCKGNSHSGAAPMTCHFYKELDAILGGDSTANLRTTMDTSERGGGGWRKPRVRVLGWGETPRSPWRLAARSSSQARRKVASRRSRYLVEDKQRSGFPQPSVLGCPCYQQLKDSKTSGRSREKAKKDLLQAVMDHSATENQKLQDWRERESRICQKNAAARKKSTKQLISILERQADSIQALVALQAEHYCTAPAPSQSSFPCALMSAQNPLLQHPGSCLQHLYVHQPALRTTTLTLCTQPPSPCSIGILKCSSHCTALQTGHIQTCDCTVPHPTHLPF